MSIHMNPLQRRAQILDKALELSKQRGYLAITRDLVATACEVSPALVSHYFAGMDGLRSEIMRAAVKRECLPVIAQGTLNRHPVAMRSPRKLRDKALAAWNA